MKNLREKKWIIVAAVVIAAAVMIFLFPRLKYVGTWEGSWYYNGNNIKVELVLNLNNTYQKKTVVGNKIKPKESGKYEIIDGGVRCYSPGFDDFWGGSYVDYQYIEGGYLQNGTNLLRKR